MDTQMLMGLIAHAPMFLLVGSLAVGLVWAARLSET
jgi:hypothetical protein